jgi:hypothetical protein
MLSGWCSSGEANPEQQLGDVRDHTKLAIAGAESVGMVVPRPGPSISEPALSHQCSSYRGLLRLCALCFAVRFTCSLRTVIG